MIYPQLAKGTENYSVINNSQTEIKAELLNYTASHNLQELVRLSEKHSYEIVKKYEEMPSS
ncbi:hypothetical protein [Algoriphagus resistens]|uniref:hypothetical protein n=1 Tax=Algoriphagus resistens TaxID=1750590 RepID=UPI0012F8BB3F|nr:hypothetical protein [Algoriphagus resistens]